MIGKETEATASEPKPNSMNLWKSNTVKVNGWLRYIVDNLHAFESCEDKKVVPHIKYDKISSHTLMKHLEKLFPLVEKKISSLLPSRFSLSYDGCSKAGTYFVAVYAQYPKYNSMGYKRYLLAFSPLENNETHSAEEPFDLLNYTRYLSMGKILQTLLR